MLKGNLSQELGKGLAGQFSSGVCHVVAGRCQPGLQSSEGSPGLDIQDGRSHC